MGRAGPYWQVESGDLLLNVVEPRELNRLQFAPDASQILAHLCHGSGKYTDRFRDVAVLYDVNSSELLGVARHNDDVDAAFLPGWRTVGCV